MRRVISTPDSRGSSDSDTPLISSPSEGSFALTSQQRVCAAPALFAGRIMLSAATATVVFLGIFMRAIHAKHADIEFDLIVSAYEIMQIMTTVGYGDFVPNSQEMRLGMSIYILVVLVLVAYAANLVSTWIINTSMDKMEKKVIEHEGRRNGGQVPPTCSKNMQPLIASSLFALSVGTGTIFFRFAEDCSCSYGDTWVHNESCPQTPASVSYEQCATSGGQVKTWIDAFYMSVVTVTTVGFGDVTPLTRTGRVFATVWMFLGVAITAFFISTLASFLFGGDEELAPEDAMDIDRTLFDRIDVSGNGTLSRAEYLGFVLVKHGLVTQDVIDTLHAKFDSFEGGESVSWEEMKRARQKLCPHHEGQELT